MLSFFDDKTEENLLQKYLLVEIADATYAFKIEYVQEIIPIIEIFTVETLENNISGLINLRGESIPVYDLANVLGKNTLKLDISQKLLILTVNGAKLALIIERVGDIVQILDENISLLSYNKNIDFLSTTVIDNKNIVVINTDNFIEYLNSSQISNSLQTTELIPSDPKLVAKIKDRTALLTRTSNNLLEQDSFLNEKFIIFSLGTEYYSFNISYIKEIRKISISSINQVPCVPEFVVGIINFRGDYISVLDIKTFLNMKSTQLPEKVSVVVLKLDKFNVGIVVDEILDVTNLPISNLNPENDSTDSYIIGELLYKEGILLNMLNVEKLFSSENVNIEDYE